MPDPEPSSWDPLEPTDGRELVRSYEWICNGQSFSNGDPSDDKNFWRGYIVVDKEYSDDNLPVEWSNN